MDREADAGTSGGRDWPLAAALFVVVLATSVVGAGVLVGVPLLLLLGRRGWRSFRVALVTALLLWIVASGSRDGVWYAERAWSILVGGGFLGFNMMVPMWGLSSRALASVGGALVTAAAVLAFRSDAWVSLDAAVSDGVRAGVDTTIDAMSTLGGEEAVSPALVTALRDVANAQVSVFPALLCLGSMAALGLAWWARARLAGEGDGALGPLRSFRFNDHLVWLLVIGLLLLAVPWGGALARVGSNAVVFMGALYALRGAAVFLFVNGGLSLLGYVTVAAGFILAAPVLVGVAVLIGIGDTWLDIRSRGDRIPTA